MRYTILAILVAPFCPGLVGLNASAIFKSFPDSAFDSTVAAMYFVIGVGVVVYMPMTLLVFLPMHLLLRKLGWKSAAAYCGLLIPLGAAFLLLQTGGYVGSIGAFLQSTVYIGIVVIVFWSIAVGLRDRPALSKSPPGTEAPPEAPSSRVD
jgi:hypothetical protein